MRYDTTTLGIAIAAAFVAGLCVQPAVRYAVTEARAAAAPLTPAVIDLAAIKHGDIPATTNPEMNSKMLVVTDNATVAIQSGNVKKHIHPKTDEIQYIVEGSGSMWLGASARNSSLVRCSSFPKARHMPGPSSPAALSRPSRSRFRRNRLTMSPSSIE